jgi:hypothetical protein
MLHLLQVLTSKVGLKIAIPLLTHKVVGSHGPQIKLSSWAGKAACMPIVIFMQAGAVECCVIV